MIVKKATKAQVRKAKELDNFQFLDVHRWSASPEVNKAVDALYIQLSKHKKFRGKSNLRKKHIKTVVLDLYVRWMTDPQRWTAYHRGEQRYRGLDERYNRLHISEMTPKVVDALKELKFVKTVKGFYQRESPGKQSYCSRMQATPALIALIRDRHHVTREMIHLAPETECIILRNRNPATGKKEQIDYEDPPDVPRMREELTTYNNLLHRSFIDLPSYPPDGFQESSRKRGRVNFSDKFIKRIFSNGSWEDGGRFYGGWWQHIPRDERPNIILAGQPVRELDYSALHIVLLYAQEGLDFWSADGGDAYSLPDYPLQASPDDVRDLLKQVLLISINAENRTKALRAINSEIREDPDRFGWVKRNKVDLGKLIDAFAARHQPIRHRFFSGSGIKLQNIDAQMAEGIIRDMTQAGIPTLCVHDSFVVGVPHSAKLWASMEKHYLATAKLLGVDLPSTPSIKPKGCDPDSYASDLSYKNEWLAPTKTSEYQEHLKAHLAANLGSNYYRVPSKEPKKIKKQVAVVKVPVTKGSPRRELPSGNPA